MNLYIVQRWVSFPKNFPLEIGKSYLGSEILKEVEKRPGVCLMFKANNAFIDTQSFSQR